MNEAFWILMFYSVICSSGCYALQQMDVCRMGYDFSLTHIHTNTRAGLCKEYSRYSGVYLQLATMCFNLCFIILKNIDLLLDVHKHVHCFSSSKVDPNLVDPSCTCLSSCFQCRIHKNSIVIICSILHCSKPVHVFLFCQTLKKIL